MKVIKATDIHNISAIVCLNGDLPNQFSVANFHNIPIISADGAAAKLLDMDIIPSLVIGDMDSFSISKYCNTFPKEKIIELPDQETNDFEKILTYCKNNNLRNLLIFGFHGGDLEHSLNNWSVLKKFTSQLNMIISDKNRLGFACFENIEIHCRKGEIISLIPQTSATISTTNLNWNLTSETLEIGKRDGVRNIALDNVVEIEIINGELLVFIDR